MAPTSRNREGKLHRAQSARDPHDTVLQRLPQRFERTTVELHDLVEKEDAVVSEADLSGPRVAPATDERHARSTVVRRTEGTVFEQPGGRFEQPGNGMDGRRGDRLLEARRRQDAWYAAGKQRLAGARWSDQQQVVSSGGRNLDRPPGAVLAAHVDEVERRGGPPRSSLDPGGHRGPGSVPQIRRELRQGSRGVQVDPCYDTPLPEVCRRQYQPLTVTRGQQRNRQRAAYRPYPAVEGKRPDYEQILEPIGRQDTCGAQQAECNRQIVRGSTLAHVGRCEVHGDPTLGESKAGVLQGAADPVAAFLDGRVGKTDDGEGRETTRHVDFDVDEQGLDPDDGCRPQLPEHAGIR